ncbi:unnamed protein product [Eruca vesicaria subsp. sativa]|uniref:AD domain-containing protein n=1 Tax=Eruca vesicaria subsp. sativa TaxID=29727 RepID=A0ABC8M974_ERUVS|nr:unnamed protein product [Eruca vesicaria subsp. sativa]
MNPANATATAAVEGGVNGDEYEVGKAYEVKLTTGIEFKGIVLAYDSDPNVVVFHILSDLFSQEGTKPETGKSMTTRTVKAKFISEATLIGKFEDPLASNKEKRFVNLCELESKEKEAIRKVESIGVGVTAEAQKIFDALAKTYNVQWDNKVIVVMENVRISSPYHSDCVTGGTRAASDQIKKVLEKVRGKLKL